jgi:hypothetical protein
MTTRQIIVSNRYLSGRSAEDIARDAGIPLETYLAWEAGELDFDDVEILDRIEEAIEKGALS